MDRDRGIMNKLIDYFLIALIYGVNAIIKIYRIIIDGRWVKGRTGIDVMGQTKEWEKFKKGMK
jgi:hypothetical protein